MGSTGFKNIFSFQTNFSKNEIKIKNRSEAGLIIFDELMNRNLAYRGWPQENFESTAYQD